MQPQLPAKITRSSVQTLINRLRNNPDYRRTNYLSKPCQRPLPAPEELRTRVPAGAYMNEDGEVYVGTCQFHGGHTVVHSFLGGDHAQG